MMTGTAALAEEYSETAALSAYMDVFQADALHAVIMDTHWISLQPEQFKQTFPAGGKSGRFPHILFLSTVL